MTLGRRISMVISSITLLACTEAVEPVEHVVPHPQKATFTLEEEGPQTPPEGVGPEYEVPVSITVTADAGFVDKTNPDLAAPNNVQTFAYGQSVINYHSTNGEASVDIVATKGGSSAGSNSAEVSGDFHVLPGSYGVVANASVLLQSACGHSVQATARGRAWNEVFVTGSWITWGLKKDSDTKANSQSACATGTPGGGGGSPPSEPPGDDCHWARDMIIFADGSWMWLNDWYIECGEENQERASPSRPSVEFGKTSARDHAQGTNLRLSLVGTGPLANGRRIAVYRDPQSSADALIAIDTTRANSADLQTALVAAAELSSREIRRGPKDVIGTVIDWPSDRAQRMARPQSIAADYLRQLSWASEKVTKLAGPGRQLDVVVDRRMLGQR